MTKTRLFGVTVIIMLYCFNSINAQEFIFDIVFSDTLGNSDTLELGYDEFATNNVDSDFEEVDIKPTPWDPTFEVRITQELLSNFVDSIQNYHLKRQIVKKECDLTFPFPVEINIKAIHWPIMAKWNSQLFLETCNEGSLITSINPGGWWDTGSPSDLDVSFFNIDSTVLFSDNIDFNANGSVNINYGYIDSTADNISRFWIGLGRENLGVTTNEIDLQSDIKVYPNPTSNYFSIGGVNKEEISKISIYSINGSKILVTEELDVHLSSLNSGVYIVKILKKNNTTIIRKIFKN